MTICQRYEHRLSDVLSAALYSPMFRVTVMMLSDIVESVTLLKDTD